MSKLNVYINADASKAIEAFGKLKEKTSDLEKGFDKIGKSFDNLGSLATKSLTVPIAGTTTALTLATKKAIDFDNGMRQVSTLLPKLSREGFEELKKETLSFSKELGKLPEEVFPALYNALSAGVPRENVFSFLQTAGEAAIAGVSDLDISVDGLTSVVNAYGDKVLNANRASDIMFQTLKLGKTDFTQLAKNISNVTPIASVLGVKFEDLGAAIAVMTAQGTQTSTSTNQIKQMLVELNKEGSTAYDTFIEISGVAFKDFIKSGGNLQEALELLSNEAKKNDKDITSFFNSVEAGNSALSLSGENAKKYKEALESVGQASNATSEAFKKIDEGPARVFERIKAEVDSLIIELGNNLLPVVEESLLPLFKDSLIPIAEKTIIAISDLIKAFNNLPAPMQGVSIGFVTMAAGFGPALKGLVSLKKGIDSTVSTISTFSKTVKYFPQYIGSIKGLSNAWKVLNSVMIASPIGVISALAIGLSALALKCYNLNKEYKELINTSKSLINTTRELNDNAFKDITLFEEYQKLASAKELDEIATERLRQVTEKLISLYPNLKTVVIDGINYIDSSRMKLEEYRTAEENNQIEVIESSIKKLEKEREIYTKAVEDYRIAVSGNFFNNDDLERNIESTSDYKELQKVNDLLSQLEGEQNDLNQIMHLRQSLTRDGIDLETKEREANKKSINAIKDKSKVEKEELEDKKKTFKDYVALLKQAEKEEDRRVANLKNIGAEISDAEALEDKKNRIKSILEEMSEALNLNANEIKYLSDNYSYALEDIKTDRFLELVKEIESSIDAYERGVEVASEFGDEINDLDKLKEKSDIVRSGIENITSEIKLTSEQVEILKAKFGELWQSPKQSFTDYFKSNWLLMLNDVIGYTSDFYTAISDMKIKQIELEIEKNEERKEKALEQIEEEKNARLKAIGIMENSQKQSLLNQINQLKNRQKVVLGLYEQERIKAELEAKQKELAKIEIEEEAKAKQLEVEKNYNNEKMRLEYNSQMESWKLSLVQAQASIAQAAINAIASAMSVPFPASVAAYATLAAIVAGGAINIASLSKTKPNEPKYLAKGGLIERTEGGVNAVIGEGLSDEAVIPLEDRILAKIGSSIYEASREEEDKEININENYNQPILLTLDGKIVASTILNLSKRGVKVVSQRGIL